MFRFVVRRLRFLMVIPGAPYIFDALLLIETTLFHPKRLRAIEQLEMEILHTLQLETVPHRFGGIEFCKHGREIGHLHGNGLLDLRVGHASRDQLIADGEAEPHHLHPALGWVSFWIHSPADMDRAIHLLKIAARFRDLRGLPDSASQVSFTR
jgi:hypothetical protein